jgi:hypothetical protein
MRHRVFIAAASLITILAVCVTTHGQAPAAKPATPVVIELFTSEGCSSCPPADDLMAMLVRDQPVKGAQIIALGLHVDYWDRLGWKDRFSSSAYTARQNEYAQLVFHTDNIYTPQLIVNGEQQIAGSDAKKIKQAIAKAAETPARVNLTVTTPGEPGADRKATLNVKATLADGAKLDEPADVLVAVTEENLMTRVLRGENEGRDMRHGTVVRIMAPVGTMAATESAWTTPQPVTFTVDKDWHPKQLRIVAIAQAKNSRRILGATISPLIQPAQATGSK